MERKIINYTVNYFERGVDKSKKITIRRIARDVIEEYNTLIANISIINEIEKERKRLIDNLGYVIIKEISLKNRIKEAKDIKEQLKHLESHIRDAKSGDLFKRAVKIVAQILEDNGIEDDELGTDRFWKRKTEERDIWDFLNAVIYKDIEIDGKKKALIM